MKKLLVALLLVCSAGAYGQYMPGGLVSQGTLMSTSTEVVRSGFDIWVGGGLGFGGYAEGEEAETSYHFDVNAGYNVLPRLFVGAGFNSTNLITGVSSAYVNTRFYFSRDLNSLYYNISFGKVLGGNVFVGEGDIYGGYNATFCKPSGVMGGFSMGYVWNHFAVEIGLSMIGCETINVNGYDVPGTGFFEIYTNPTSYSWETLESYSYGGSESSVLLDAFLRVSWRF